MVTVAMAPPPLALKSQTLSITTMRLGLKDHAFPAASITVAAPVMIGLRKV